MLPFLNLTAGKLRPTAVLFFICFLSFAAQAQTFQAVPLDCGGWLSGFAQADNGRIYAYGDVFGAWRTDNVGLNWTYLNWGIPDGDIVGTGMAVQKNNADVVYYATDNALYKSTNGGADWTKLLGDIGFDTPRFRGTSPILIRSNNPNEIWFAGPRKNLTGWLWKSSDGGATWNKAGGSTFDTNKARTLHNISAYANQIWVGADLGLYVSTDGGNNFAQVSNHPEVGMIQRFTTGANAGVGLIARGSVNGDGGGVSRITASDYNNTGTYSAARAATENLYFGYPSGLQIFSDNTASAWNTGADRHGFSTDGGLTFKLRGTSVNTTHVPIWTSASKMTARNHPDYGTDHVIQVGNDPNRWIITGGGAAMQSLDKGLSWSYFPNGSGIAGVKTYSAVVSRHDVNRIYLPAADIGSAIVTDGGASGQATRSSAKTLPYLHSAFRIMEGPDLNNLALAGVNQEQDRNVLLKSGDGGVNWVEASLGNLPASTEGIVKSVMSLTNANDFLVVLSEAGSPAQRVYRTTNGGASFNNVSGLPDNSPTGHRYDPYPVFIERDATQANVRYFVARGQNFFKSTDGGSNWNPTGHPFGLGVWVWGLVADPIRSGNLWAAGDYAGVKYSFDGGTTWTSTAKYFNARHVGACDGKIAVWGRADGESGNRLWYSNDNGVTWTAQTTFAKNFHGVQGLTVDRNGKIWVSWNSATVVTPVTNSGFSGTYKITARHSGKALDVSNSSNAEGGNVQQWTGNGTFAQQWVITATTDGYYRIVNKGSNKALEVAGNGTTDGANVQQWSYAGTNSQQWKIEATTDGFFRLLNRHSGKALDVSGVSTADGANVHQWTYGGGGNQQWKLEQLSTATARVASAEPTAAMSSDGLTEALLLYPNPVTAGTLYLELGAKEAGKATVVLTNAVGQVKSSERIPVKEGHNSFKISTRGLASGLYVITIAQGSSRTVKKICIR